MPRDKKYSRLKPGEMTLFVHGWSKALNKRFKVMKAKIGGTSKSVITEAVERWLKENKG